MSRNLVVPLERPRGHCGGVADTQARRLFGFLVIILLCYRAQLGTVSFFGSAPFAEKSLHIIKEGNVVGHIGIGRFEAILHVSMLVQDHDHK